MNRKFIQIISTLGIVWLVSTNLTFMLFTEGLTNPGSNNELRINASVNFTEDFTTTTYLDPTTTADGWGSGIVINERDIVLSALGFYETNNPLRAIEVQGRRVYGVQYNALVSTESLNVFDISDPANIMRTGFRTSMPGQMAIAVEGDAVYAGRAHDVPLLASYYYTNPYSIGTHLGNTQCDGNITDIETNGYLVYYTAYNSESGYSVRVMNAEDPSSHINITASWMSSNALGLAVDGNMLYVAASTEGFYALNVTDQNAFVETGYVDTPGNATDVIIDGNFAYLADGEAGVHILDISNPASPSILSTYDTDGFARKLVKQGNTLFVADGDNGIVVLDLVNPLVPISVPSPGIVPFVWDVDLYGGVLVVASDDGLHTFNVGPGITNIANTVFPNIFDGYEAWDVRIDGNIAIVAGGPDGIYTLDVSDPNNPILLGQDNQTTNDFYRKLDIQGNFAYVADYGPGGGLQIYDISDPTNLVHIELEGLSYATDVAVYGDMAIVADGTYGVYLYNISDTSNAFYAGFFDIFNNVTAVWMQGPHLYVVEDNGGAVVASLYIYDMTDFVNEVQIGFHAVDGMFYDIWVDGDLAYTADHDWMLPYNVTDPTTPGWTTWTNNDSFGVWGFGPYCLSTGVHGVDLCDLSDPYFADPVISSYPLATGGKQITTSGDYTYVANTTSLIILRHFESLADTYVAGTTFAQSLEIDALTFGVITSATLSSSQFLPPGSQADYFLSVDGGLNWEAVIPGTPHEFVNKGMELLWRVEISGPRYSSPHIYDVSIDYETSIFSNTFIYILAGAGGGLILIIVLIVVFSAIRKRKKTPTR
jgi:hypothetical protein